MGGVGDGYGGDGCCCYTGMQAGERMSPRTLKLILLRVVDVLITSSVVGSRSSNAKV